MTRILLATPWFSEHLDAGLFWAQALGQLGYDVVLWDHRAEPEPPRLLYQGALVMKGDAEIAEKLRPRTPNVVSYWPDWFDRTPGLLEQLLRAYDVVATPVRPTPEDCMWLPTGWSSQLHRDLHLNRPLQSLAVGTYSPRKWRFLQQIAPQFIMGNGWVENISHYPRILPPLYGPAYTTALNQAYVLVNVHRDDVGVNRRLFEMCGCGFTLTDIVPGVEDVLGSELANAVGFRTPQEGRDKLQYYLAHQEEREALWRREVEAIQPYSYRAAAARLLISILA